MHVAFLSPDKVDQFGRTMAAGASVKRTCLRLCRRRKYFLYLSGLLLLTQFYIGYSFYRLNQEELNELRRQLDARQSRDLTPGMSSLALDSRVDYKDIPAMKNYGNDDYKAGIGNQSKPSDQGAAAAGVINGLKSKILDGMNSIDGDHWSKKVSKALKGAFNPLAPGGPTATGTAGNKSQLDQRVRLHCTNISKDAQSAVSRAKTLQCKQKLADIACQHSKKSMFAESLPRYCPLKGSNKLEYIGCFEDTHKDRLLGSINEKLATRNSPEACVNLCLTSGHLYAGVQYGEECWCGDTLRRDWRTDDAKCDHECPADATQRCGGYLALNVYHTGVGVKPQNDAPYIAAPAPNVTPVRIAFVLTVNGRADRQVRRLFKAIYHTQHYYFIHVDSRQEHLYREMSVLAERFPNVRLSSRRLSTIWGGASLLTMLLNCMQELLSMTDWHWDFFLNLSESDFPIKPLDELVTYLSANKNMNFVKAHGPNTAKFIRKQGYDFVFYECDTHMWRLDRRHVPYDVVWSGGSDWICLNKAFCDYIITSQDELVRGLKHYFEYALLPAESFFHTTLLNSAQCDTFVNNNLHATNWNRKQGCKCQYRHIVDWCGCSPNDYLPKDFRRLQKLRASPTYFARKFEHIISASVIAAVEMQVVPGVNWTQNLQGAHSYWQNEFDHLDASSSTNDAHFTYYHSFARLAVAKLADTKSCIFHTDTVLEAHVYSFTDKIQGISVLFNASINGVTVQLESLLQRSDFFNKQAAISPANRLTYVEVGSLWDPKEETFRNYGRLLGPHDDVILALWCLESDVTDVKYSVVYVDPAYVIAASYDVTVPKDQHVLTHKPDFKKPLRPGQWTVRVLYGFQTVAETLFHVTPLSHGARIALTSNQTAHLHNGPRHNKYVDKSFASLNPVLKLSNIEERQNAAEENGRKSGRRLLRWIDTLTAKLYSVSESCIVGSAAMSTACPTIPECKQTKWSSQSPDPKSELGAIDPLTHMFRR